MNDCFLNDITADEKPYIRELQGYLRTVQREAQGYTDVPADGFYGSATEDAVRQLQRAASLPETGRVDGATWEAAVAASRQIEDAQTLPTWVYAFRYGQPPMKTGDHGDGVFILQAMLMHLCDGYGNLPAATAPDGVYSANTAAIVQTLQRLSGLPETGAVDKSTWDAIASLYNGGVSG